MMARDTSHPVTFFKDFVQADTFPIIIDSFKRLCDSLDIDTKDFETVYAKLKDGIRTVEAVNLWKLLDKRAELNVYNAGNICKGKKVFIIGAGICGLRMALEARLLGSQVVVIDMRDYVTRNNVIHLWPPVIHDLKAIGAKTFYKKFCMGSLDHISIRVLQCILLKIALVVGVEIHAPVKYVELKPPSSNKGWTAILEPADHPVNNYEFDFIVGADGKRNSLKGFRRKCFRAKQAIAITFNLVNNKTKADNQVEEIIGTKTLYVFGRHLFNKLKTKADIDLENLVYFKDETHYFVMTARKSSLLKRGVLKEDTPNDRELLSTNNVNKDNLRSFAIDASQIATDYAMPSKQFNQTHCGEDDIAIFDFSTIFQCEHSTLIRHIDGHDLVVTNVGDGLIEPFWPTGSGAGRGFLSVLDTAWLLRMWGQGRPPLDCLAEKETLYQMLLQFPGSLKKEFSGYTVDPSTRFIDMADKVFFSHKHVEHLYMTQDEISNETDGIIKTNNDLLNHSASTSEK